MKIWVDMCIPEDTEKNVDQADGKKCGIPWFYFVRMKISTVDIGLYLSDIGSDIWTIYMHISNCNYYWAFTTALFIMLPSLPLFMEHIKDKIGEIKAGKFNWWGCTIVGKTKCLFFGLVYLHLAAVGFLLGGIVILAFYQIGFTIFCMYKTLKNPPGRDNNITSEDQRNAFKGKFIECQLEAAPQCIFQVISLFVLVYQLICACSSGFSGVMDSPLLGSSFP